MTQSAVKRLRPEAQEHIRKTGSKGAEAHQGGGRGRDPVDSEAAEAGSQPLQAGDVHSLLAAIKSRLQRSLQATMSQVPP